MVNDARAEPSLGRLIRQLRREHDLTQTQLGGADYSKSYISAVEGDRISPSPAALQFFAKQLGLPSDYFTKFPGHAGSSESELCHTESEVIENHALRILDRLLERGELPDVRAFQFPELTREMITNSPPSDQLRYFLLSGLIAQSKGEFLVALHDLESALPLAPARLQPAILDALGQNYYLTERYAIALNYTLRALHLLQATGMDAVMTPLQMRVEQHGGDVYRALGAYPQACGMYERAHSHLSAEHDLHTAANLYLDLGYCTYGRVRPSKVLATFEEDGTSPEEMVDLFERAIRLFTHSRSVYRISRDHLGETAAGLFLAQTELDFSARQRQLIQDRASSEGERLVAHCTSLLENVEEQCHQIMLTWQETVGTSSTPPERLDGMLYMTLAALVRVFTERARLARINERPDMSLREQSIAAHLCQDVLEVLSEHTFPWPLIAKILTAPLSSPAFRPPTLPRPPDGQAVPGNARHRLIGRVEVYCAAGEVAEELGRVATDTGFAHDCYTRADQFLLAALNLARLVVSMGERDPGYLIRCYERYALLLKERSTAAGDLWGDTVNMLLELLKQGISQVQQSMLPINFE